jgi:hypothetical protein
MAGGLTSSLSSCFGTTGSAAAAAASLAVAGSMLCGVVSALRVLLAAAPPLAPPRARVLPFPLAALGGIGYIVLHCVTGGGQIFSSYR